MRKSITLLIPAIVLFTQQATASPLEHKMIHGCPELLPDCHTFTI